MESTQPNVSKVFSLLSLENRLMKIIFIAIALLILRSRCQKESNYNISFLFFCEKPPIHKLF